MKNTQRYPVPAPHVKPRPVGVLRPEPIGDAHQQDMLDLLYEGTRPLAGEAHVVALVMGVAWLGGIALLLSVMYALNEWWE